MRRAITYGFVGIIGFLLFSTCDLKSEFDVNPTDFFMQKKVRADQVLGFVPANVIDWRDFSVRGFLLGDDPYFAVKTNYKVEANPGIYIVNKELNIVKKLTRSHLTYGGDVWDPSLSYWSISGNRAGTHLFLNFNTNLDSGFFMSFNVAVSTFKATESYTAASKHRTSFRVGDINFHAQDGVLIPNENNLIGSFGSGATFYTVGTSLRESFQQTGVGAFGLSESGYRRIMNYGSTVVMVAPLFGDSTTYFGLPVFFAGKNIAINAVVIDAIIAVAPDTNVQFKFDPVLDGVGFDAQRYIDEMALVKAGLILPYPSGRDRLIDIDTGKVLHTFVISPQDQNHLDETKERFNHPRAYISNRDIWFMYDQDSREFKRLAGWWL